MTISKSTAANRYRQSLKRSKNIVVWLAIALSILVGIINIQFYKTWASYNAYLGDKSPTQDWLNRDLLSFSVETYDMIGGILRIQIGCLNYATGSISKSELDIQRQQVASMLPHFDTNTAINKQLRQHDSFLPAVESLRSYLNTVLAYQEGQVGLSFVSKSAENTLSDWMLLKSDALEKEYRLRDNMEKTIISFRPLAQQTLLIVGVMSFLCVITVFMALFAGWRLITTERKRFDSFELLVASVGHDLRSPLQTIQSASSLLVRNTDEESRAHYGAMVKTATKTLSRLVDDILQIVRQERLSVDTRQVDVKEWIESFVSSYRAKAERNNLSLNEDIDIPFCCIEIDPDRLAQCIGNLLDNAIRYTIKGSVNLSMRIKTDAEKKHLLVIVVSDTGPGIHKSNLKRIFEPFKRASTVDLEHGMGLGLSIVDNLARSLEGSIDVSSEINVGSKFTLTIPVRNVDKPSHEEAVITYDHSLNNKTDKSIEILVIDDDDAIRASVADLLIDAGFSVDVADNGVSGFEKIRSNSYLVVLTDIQMPGMCGFKLAEKCKTLGNCPQLIAMTAYPENFTADKRSRYFDAILTKVFSDESLLNVIDRAMV